MIMLISLPFMSSPNNGLKPFKGGAPLAITCPEKKRKIHVKPRFMGCFKGPRRHLVLSREGTPPRGA